MGVKKAIQIAGKHLRLCWVLLMITLERTRKLG
jgi:hypothetical protein